MKRILLIGLLISIQSHILAQHAYQNSGNRLTDIKVVLDNLEKKFKINFSYPDDLILGKKVYAPDYKKNLDDILFDLQIQTGIDFNKIDRKFIYLSPTRANQLTQIVVKGYLTRGIYKNSDGSFGFMPKKFGLLPGLSNHDVLAAILFLPGVSSTDGSIGNFTVHGGNIDENGILWDGIKIYHQGHLFGMISPFNPYVVEQVNFLYKGTDVEFQDFSSGIVNIQTQKKITNRLKLQSGFDGLSGDFILEIPVIKNKLSLQTSFRRSYEDVLETGTFVKYEAQAFQNSKINDKKFYFKDYNFKLNFYPNKKNYFGISTLHIDNDLENDLLDTEHNNYHEILDMENDGFSLEWNYKPDKNRRWKNNFTYSSYYFTNSYKTRSVYQAETNFSKENFINNGNIKSVFYKTKKQYLWKIGWESDYKHILYSFQEKNGLTLMLDRNNSKLLTHSFFGMFQWHKKRYWDISIGLRSNYYVGFKKLVAEPRLRINRFFGDNFQLQWTADYKHQPVVQIRQTVLSDLDRQQKIWRLVDLKRYPMLKSYQYSAGILYKKRNFNIDLDFYYKHTRGITSYSLGFLNPDDPQLHQGQQKAYGIDFFGKRKWKNFSLQMSYSYLIAQRQFDGINHGKWFVSDNEIKHSFSLIANYRYKHWGISSGWKIRSGLPYTELELTEDNDGDMNEGFYEFDGINSERLPVYYRFDFSAGYHFMLSKKNNIRAKAGISLKNFTDNQVQTGMYYTGNNSLNDRIRVIKSYSVGIIPNFSFRIKL